MIETIFGSIGFFMVLGAFLIKSFNIIKGGKLYNFPTALIITGLAVIGWVLFITSMISLIRTTDVVTAVGPSGTTTISSNPTDYVPYAAYLGLVNGFFLISIFFTGIELLFFVGSSVKKNKSPKDSVY